MLKRLFARKPRARREDIERYVRMEYKPEDYQSMVTQLMREWDAR